MRRPDDATRVATAMGGGSVVPYHRVSDPKKLHALLDAVLVVEAELDPVRLLHQIVASAAGLVGARYAALGVLGPVTEEPGPVHVDDLAAHPDAISFPAGHPPVASFLGVPLLVRGEVFANLYLAEEPGGRPFSEEDEQLIVAFAAAAGIAVDNARLHGRDARLQLVEERERIARDLHDSVVQRLFGIALSMQVAGRLTEDATVADRLRSAGTELDETIRQVRTTIYALEPPPVAHGGLRTQILGVRAGVSRSLGFEPKILFAGLIDLVPDVIGAEVLATLRESLSNVARHAAARSVAIEVTVLADTLHLHVADDGRGIPADSAGGGRGLASLAERARALGGTCRWSPRPGGGTCVDWCVPLRSSPGPRPAGSEA